MSNSYQNGKIYKITSSQTDLIYVGSTIQSLDERFKKHKNNFKNNNSSITSKEILKYDDAKIELIELYPCNSQEELYKREGVYIKTLNCVNRKVEGRDSKSKEYYEENKEKMKEYQKEYRQRNKEIYKEYMMQYAVKNQNRIKQNRTQREKMNSAYYEKKT